MQWHTKHSSKTCMFLLKCLHVMDENVTHPFPHLEPSLTPSHMHMPIVRNIVFKTKGFFLFLKTRCSISDKILLDNPPNKYVGQSSKVNCWTTLRNSPLDILRRELLDTFPNYSDNFPIKFSFDNPQIFIRLWTYSDNQLRANPPKTCHALTPTILGCPSAYEMKYAISQ